MRRAYPHIAVAITAALFSINTYSARADISPSPTPSPSIDSYKAAQEQFKKDRDAFAIALRNRDIKMREINSIFKISIDKANAEAKSAMAIAITPEQKNAINSNRRASIAAAIVARENAIAALGPMPTPPAEPARPLKNSPMGMGEKKEKQKR